MKLEVEAISQDTVKPSFPTPPHLHHYQLSFLDQLQPLVFMPLVHFYPKYSDTNLTNTEQSDRIKKSLSDALTRFYVLAGRVKDNLYVDCNDEGVPYVEAKANCKLSEFLEDPIPGELNKFLPFELDEVNELPAAVQVTFFNCGGLVIGVLVSHRIIDASSFILFLNSWAAIARGHGNIVTPPMDSATLFPPQELSGLNMNIGITKDNIVTKRFVFDASAIGSIREKYSSDDKSIEYPRPTRVEALSAFIWSRFMASTQSKPDPNKIYKIVHALNLLPSRDTEVGFYGIIKPMREAIQKIDGDFVKMLQQGDVYLKYMKENLSNFVKGELVTLSFTSLCRFPLYEVDFGWGKPAWVTSAKFTFKNLITFIDAKSGDKIEVWINLKVEDMAKFETDNELLAFVSPKNFVLG
ncbi:hypothetical protein RGQ29_015321 [Quercus rubra]|uniref:Vinorine synthase n=1 Tax=Quercus rubra TaxID=3512 RepID=A0AAN7FNY6_QUERU|nr:hypothetical protein RGQ29_015321 [Quercus rubra]